MTRVTLLGACLALVACSKPPPPKPPPAERAAKDVADIAGRWVTSDDMDWSYSMKIGADGIIDVWIDRGKTGRCQQRGTIEPGSASGLFRVIYTRGECNPQAVNVPLELEIRSFTGESLTVVVANQPRTYQRVSDEESDGDTPAQLTK
jgi:hypothetical protein